MTYTEFLKLVEHMNIEATEGTLLLWHHIYAWIAEHGYADTADSPEFVKYVQSFRHIGARTIGRHLRSMSEADLLSRHILRRRLSQEAKEELLNPVVNIFFGGRSLPSSFARYSLAGKPCSREFKSALRSLESIENRMNELLRKSSD